MKKIKIQPIGQRIIKSAVGVFLCYLIYFIRGQNGTPFYTMLAVLWCIQPYTEKTHEMALQRTVGTIIGAIYGLVAILLEIYVFDIYDNFKGYFLNAVFIIPVLYTTVLLNKKNTSYFSCVVYLSIAVNHMTDTNPYIFVFNRVIDTFIGIAIGIAVNSAHLPRKKKKDTLFVIQLDDMISPVHEEISAYSKIEINRMISEGMRFTVATMRTPANLINLLNGININIPVITMNGAVLYDFKENTYIKAYVISNQSCCEIVNIIHEKNMNCFINALCDDTLIIYYDKLENYAEKAVFSTLKRSPHRNYIQRNPSEYDKVIYIMLIDKTEKAEELYNWFIAEKYNERFRILCYKSDDYSGYSYIKIYNKNAGIRNMIQLLSDSMKINAEVIESDKENPALDKTIKKLKSSYEPFIFRK